MVGLLASLTWHVLTTRINTMGMLGRPLIVRLLQRMHGCDEGPLSISIPFHISFTYLLSVSMFPSLYHLIHVHIALTSNRNLMSYKIRTECHSKENSAGALLE